MACLFLFQEMHFNGSDKNDNQMDHCEMFAEDVALFDYHFYQSCCNWRRELCSELFYIYFYAFYSILPESTYLQARSHNEANEAVASPKISKKKLPQM